MTTNTQSVATDSQSVIVNNLPDAVSRVFCQAIDQEQSFHLLATRFGIESKYQLLKFTDNDDLESQDIDICFEKLVENAQKFDNGLTLPTCQFDSIGEDADEHLGNSYLLLLSADELKALRHQLQFVFSNMLCANHPNIFMIMHAKMCETLKGDTLFKAVLDNNFAMQPTFECEKQVELVVSRTPKIVQLVFTASHSYLDVGVRFVLDFNVVDLFESLGLDLPF